MRRAVAAVFIWLLLASGAWAACPAVPSDCGSPTVNDLTIGGEIVQRPNNPTSLTNLGGTGALNATNFYSGSTFYQVVCDGVTDNTTAMQAAAATGRDIYLPKSTSPCVFGDVILTTSSLYGYLAQVQAPPGARWIVSTRGQNTIAGLSVYGASSPGEVAVSTISSVSQAGATSVVAAPEATASAATASGTALTLDGSVTGTFTKNMMVCDGASTKLCATSSGYIVSTTLHILSTSQGQVAVGQIIQTAAIGPNITIAEQLPTSGGDVSTWRLSSAVSLGNIGSSLSPQTVFSAMTIVGTPVGTAAVISGDAGTVSASAISGTRFEVGERAQFQLDNRYRHSTMVLGVVQSATQVTLTIGKPIPQATLLGGTIWATWGGVNVGCDAAIATVKDIVFTRTSWAGLLVGCPTPTAGITVQARIENISTRDGLRMFIVAMAGRAGPVLVDGVRFNENWSRPNVTLTGDGTTGPYSMPEATTYDRAAGAVTSLTVSGVPYTQKNSFEALGPTNYAVEANQYQLMFGAPVTNGAPIVFTMGNLPGVEGIVMDNWFGILSGRMTSSKIIGPHGGNCQVCYASYTSTSVTSQWLGLFGDPALESMVVFDGNQTVNLDTGKLSGSDRANYQFINRAVVTGSINSFTVPSSLSTIDLNAINLTLDPAGAFYGTSRNNDGQRVSHFSKSLQYYVGTPPPVSTSGTCTVTSDVAVGTFDIPCDPTVTFQGYMVDNAMTITSGGVGLAVGMQINAQNQGIPFTTVTVGSIGGGGSVTLVGAGSLGSIGTALNPVDFTATDLHPRQVYTGSSVHTPSNTAYLPAWATVIGYDGQVLHLSNRVTGDTGGSPGIPAGTVLNFAGPVQPGGLSGPFRSGTWGAKPSAITSPNVQYFATDLGPSGCMIWSTGAVWRPVGECVLYSRTSATSTTNDTLEHNLDFFAPANGVPSATGSLQIVLNAIGTGTNGTKSISVRLGASPSPTTSGGCQFILNTTSGATPLGMTTNRFLWSQGSLSSQSTSALASFGLGESALAPVTCSVDTSGAHGLSFNGYVANAGDTIAYQNISVIWRE